MPKIKVRNMRKLCDTKSIVIVKIIRAWQNNSIIFIVFYILLFLTIISFWFAYNWREVINSCKDFVLGFAEKYNIELDNAIFDCVYLKRPH